MAEIKTKEVFKDIRVFDKASTVCDRMKESYVKTKDSMRSLSDDGQASPSEYAEDQVEYAVKDVTYEAGHTVKRGAEKTVDTTVKKAKDAYRKSRDTKINAKKSKTPQEHRIKTQDKTKKTVKQTTKSTEKATVKTQKTSVKASKKAVKTSEKAAKTTIKTAEKTAKATKEAAKASVKAAKAAVQAAKAAAKTVVAAAKVAAKAIVAAVKGIIAGIKALVAAIASGGWVAVLIIVIICVIALILCTCFGIFFSSEDTGTQSMKSVVQEMDAEYQADIQTIKDETDYDVLEMNDSAVAWKEVLSVYSVKMTTDPYDPQEVASMSESKKATLKEIFWTMHTISNRTETKEETVVIETTDANGNIVKTSKAVTKVYLYISITHKTADEMAEHYGFSAKQKEQLTTLLDDANNEMWTAVLDGVKS